MCLDPSSLSLKNKMIFSKQKGLNCRNSFSYEQRVACKERLFFSGKATELQKYFIITLLYVILRPSQIRVQKDDSNLKAPFTSLYFVRSTLARFISGQSQNNLRFGLSSSYLGVCLLTNCKTSPPLSRLLQRRLSAFVRPTLT